MPVTYSVSEVEEVNCSLLAGLVAVQTAGNVHGSPVDLLHKLNIIFNSQGSLMLTSLFSPPILANLLWSQTTLLSFLSLQLRDKTDIFFPIPIFMIDAL